jgi:hypothetical protein
MIQAKFDLNWASGFRRRFFKKFTDGRRKKGNNSKIGNGIYFKIAG